MSYFLLRLSNLEGILQFTKSFSLIAMERTTPRFWFNCFGVGSGYGHLSFICSTRWELLDPSLPVSPWKHYLECFVKYYILAASPSHTRIWSSSGESNMQPSLGTVATIPKSPINFPPICIEANKTDVLSFIRVLAKWNRTCLIKFELQISIYSKRLPDAIFETCTQRKYLLLIWKYI